MSGIDGRRRVGQGHRGGEASSPYVQINQSAVSDNHGLTSLSLSNATGCGSPARIVTVMLGAAQTSSGQQLVGEQTAWDSTAKPQFPSLHCATAILGGLGGALWLFSCTGPPIMMLSRLPCSEQRHLAGGWDNRVLGHWPQHCCGHDSKWW